MIYLWVMQSFGEWLRNELHALEWSQADLERASGVSSAQISRILSGARGVEAESLRAFAKALGKSQAELFYAAGQLTEKPGEMVIHDPVLADIWMKISRMGEGEKLAAVVLLETILNRGGGDDGRKESADSGTPRKSKSN